METQDPDHTERKTLAQQGIKPPNPLKNIDSPKIDHPPLTLDPGAYPS
jgi:hypothetical protein